MAAGAAQPGNAHSVTQLKTGHQATHLCHTPYHLMPWHGARRPRRQIPIDNVQIGATDATGEYLEEQVVRSWFRHWQIGKDQRLPRRAQGHGPHTTTSPRLFRIHFTSPSEIVLKRQVTRSKQCQGDTSQMDPPLLDLVFRQEFFDIARCLQEERTMTRKTLILTLVAASR